MMQKMTQNMLKKNNTKKTILLYPKESYIIRGIIFDLYKQLGFGHKEVVYQRGLEVKLSKAGFNVNREKQIPVLVDGKKVGVYIPDFVVNDSIMIELKASTFITKQDIMQFWQYLRVAPYKLGFLINFGKPGGVEIIRRVYESARKEDQRVSA